MDGVSMHKLVILIEELEDPQAFEAGWPRFLHWAEQMPGLRREVTSRATHNLYGRHPISLVHELFFDDAQSAYRAMDSPQGQAAGQTLQAITGGQMTLLFAEHQEDSLENIRQARAGDGEAGGRA
jgi:uncharacterized protein (TIGR02118 family)